MCVIDRAIDSTQTEAQQFGEKHDLSADERAYKVETGERDERRQQHEREDQVGMAIDHGVVRQVESGGGEIEQPDGDAEVSVPRPQHVECGGELEQVDEAEDQRRDEIALPPQHVESCCKVKQVDGGA